MQESPRSFRSTDQLRKRRALVVDPFPCSRASLRDIASESFEIVRPVDCTSCGLEAMRQNRFDLVIIDLDASTATEVRQFCVAAQQMSRETNILALGSQNIDDDVAGMLFGCDLYLCKKSSLEEIKRALDFLLETPTSCADHTSERGRAGRSGPSLLSPRERQIHQMMLLDLSNNEIGELLALSSQTVRNYTSSVLQKLECESRSNLKGRVATTDVACTSGVRGAAC